MAGSMKKGSWVRWLQEHSVPVHRSILPIMQNFWQDLWMKGESADDKIRTVI